MFCFRIGADLIGWKNIKPRPQNWILLPVLPYPFDMGISPTPSFQETDSLQTFKTSK